MGIFGKKRQLFDSSKTPHSTNTYRLQGKNVVCTQCGFDQFNQAMALLNTPGMTFMGLDWANRTATLLCCKQCGKIEWYLRPPGEWG